MFVNLMINRLKELGVDPKDKTVVFSNALDMENSKTFLNIVQEESKKLSQE